MHSSLVGKSKSYLKIIVMISSYFLRRNNYGVKVTGWITTSTKVANRRSPAAAITNIINRPIRSSISTRTRTYWMSTTDMNDLKINSNPEQSNNNTESSSTSSISSNTNTNTNIMQLSLNGTSMDVGFDENNNNNNNIINNNNTIKVNNTSNSVASDVLAIDPADICIVEKDKSSEEEINNNYNNDDKATTTTTDLLRHIPFVSMFRGSANYIANHRNTVAVYHIPGGLITKESVFRDLMNDVALTWLLGMKIVLVAGCRYQVQERIGLTLRHGLRVTDAESLRIVKEEAGYVRFEVERQLARSLRMQGGASATNTNTNNRGKEGSGILNNKIGYYDGNVVSGNFYSAQPLGVQDGIDYEYTGFVRRVEVEKIKQLHAQRDICLLSTLGVSPSGEVFNVNSESLAAITAGALGASKLIFFTEREMDIRHAIHGNKIQSLRLSDAKNLLKYHGIQTHRKGFVTLNNDEDDEDETTLPPSDMEMLLKVGWCTEAIQMGVKRAHIISPQHGALLQELYTRDGSGTLISADLYEGIRRATVLDVSSIYQLIEPLIAAGTLIDRPKATLEKDIDTYYVYTRDNHIVACGQLKKFELGYAEIGCLVVNKDYRALGRGDAMLGYLERLCLLNGCTNVFVLSTQTMEWFVERGFDEAKVEQLPPSRQATYNHQRKSKIYLKKIESTRDLDASELWWNR